MNKIIHMLFVSILLTSQATGQHTDHRDVKSFDKIAIKGSMDVTLVQGNSEKIDITVDGADASDVITEVSAGKLKVGMRNRNYKNLNVHLKIYFKDLHEISQHGSGETELESGLKTDHLTLSLLGSGNFAGKLTVTNLTLKLNGSGDIDVSGTTQHQTCTLHGSGDIDATALKSENVDAQVTGSGDIDVWVTKHLKAKVVGSGDISYVGKPSKVTSKVIGSGDIEEE